MHDSHGCNRSKGIEAINQGSIKGGHVSITCYPWLGRLHEPRLKRRLMLWREMYVNMRRQNELTCGGVYVKLMAAPYISLRWSQE
jgi:hypothetical protein